MGDRRLKALPEEFQALVPLVKSNGWGGECQEAYRSLIKNNEYYRTEDITKTLAKDRYLLDVLKTLSSIQAKKSSSSIPNSREAEDADNLADIKKIAAKYSEEHNDKYSKGNNLHRRFTDATSYYYRNALRQLGHKDGVKEVLKQLIELEKRYITGLAAPNGAPQPNYRAKQNPIEIIHYYLSGRLAAGDRRLTALPADFKEFIGLVKEKAWNGECQGAYRTLIQNNEYYHTEDITKTLAKDDFLLAVLDAIPVTEELNSGGVARLSPEEYKKLNRISDEVANRVFKVLERARKRLKDSSSPNIAESRALNQPSTFRIKKPVQLTKPENEPRYSKDKVGHNFIFTHKFSGKQYILLRETDKNGDPLEKVRWLEQPVNHGVITPAELSGGFKAAAGIVRNNSGAVVIYSNTVTFKANNSDGKRFNLEVKIMQALMEGRSAANGQNIQEILAEQKGLAFNQLFYYKLNGKVNKLIIAPKQAYGEALQLRLLSYQSQPAISHSVIFTELKNKDSKSALVRFQSMLLGGFKRLAQQIDFASKIPDLNGGSKAFIHQSNWDERISVHEVFNQLYEEISGMSKANRQKFKNAFDASKEKVASCNQKKDQFAYLHTFFELINLKIKSNGVDGKEMDGWGRVNYNVFHSSLPDKTEQKLRAGLKPYIKAELLDEVIRFITDPRQYSLPNNNLADIFRDELSLP